MNVSGVLALYGGKNKVRKSRGRKLCLYDFEHAAWGFFVHTEPRLCVIATWCFFTRLMYCVYVAEHKVIIVGLDNAGKTTILYQL